MPRDGYQSITVREDTFKRLAADKPDDVAWTAYIEHLFNSANSTESRTPDREFTANPAPEPSAGCKYDRQSAVELTDAERERLLDGVERVVREMAGGPY